MESKNCRGADCREDEDEEKMELFFAMMNNFRNKLQQLQRTDGNKRKKAAAPGGGGWAPAFQLEDFTSEIEFKKHVPNHCNNVGNNRDDKHLGDPTSSRAPPNLKLTL